MSAASAQTALALIRSESILRHGPVPHTLGGAPVQAGHYRLHGDAFLLRTETGLGFHYRRGDGVTLEQAAPVTPGEVELWYHGSVYAAIAAINGLVPLHASAVECNGRVHAFAGPSGAGKSTLAAGLGREGLPLFCDDTLLLDLSDPDAVWCLPGHKRLKLHTDALTLTGAVAEEHVGAMIDKHYARPLAGAAQQPLPLASLAFIVDGPVAGLSALPAGERIAHLNDGHYTTDYLARARHLDRVGLLAHLTALAGRIPASALHRPRDPARFAETLGFVATRLRNMG